MERDNIYRVTAAPATAQTSTEHPLHRQAPSASNLVDNNTERTTWLVEELNAQRVQDDGTQNLSDREWPNKAELVDSIFFSSIVDFESTFQSNATTTEAKKIKKTNFLCSKF